MENNSANIYIGRGYGRDHQDFVDFINYVFGFNGDGSDFIKLLPKLYKPENNPCENNHVVMENGKFKAAVGVFPSVTKVCGYDIICHGIGNVAVHPYSRSKGYMRKLMQISMDEMISDGADISALGGRRQRYGYYSFEHSGRMYHFDIDGGNIQHCFGDSEISKKMTARKISRNDEKKLADIKKLSDSKILHPLRGEGAHLYDIMTSWRAGVWVFYENESEKLAGYAIVNGNSITELILADENDFYDIIRTYMRDAGKWDISITIPPFQPEFIKLAQKIAEDYSTDDSEMYTVLNYKKVCEAFLKLRNTYNPLADGELTLFIHGYAKDEKLRFKVSGGEVSVSDASDVSEFDVELTHSEAMAMLFGNISIERENLSPIPKSWLPLPLFHYNADHV